MNDESSGLFGLPASRWQAEWSALSGNAFHPRNSLQHIEIECFFPH
jgi:hypothetical protein